MILKDISFHKTRQNLVHFLSETNNKQSINEKSEIGWELVNFLLETEFLAIPRVTDLYFHHNTLLAHCAVYHVHCLKIKKKKYLTDNLF